MGYTMNLWDTPWGTPSDVHGILHMEIGISWGSPREHFFCGIAYAMPRGTCHGISYRTRKITYG